MVNTGSTEPLATVWPEWRGSRPSRLCLILLNRGRGFSDHIEHEVRLGQHRYVAAIGLEDRSSHTFCDETLQLGLDGTVLRCDDVPTRLRLPSRTVYLLIEQISYGCGMSGPDQLLLFIGEIAGKGRDAIPFQPKAAVRNLDMRKNIGCRKLLLQALCCLVGIRGKRRDVDERCNSWVSSGRRDDRTTVGVTD